MHKIGLGKGKRLARESGESLAQGEVESFDVVGLPLFFGGGAVLRSRDDLLVGLPKVGVNQALAVGVRNLMP